MYIFIYHNNGSQAVKPIQVSLHVLVWQRLFYMCVYVST